MLQILLFALVSGPVIAIGYLANRIAGRILWNPFTPAALAAVLAYGGLCYLLAQSGEPDDQVARAAGALLVPALLITGGCVGFAIGFRRRRRSDPPAVPTSGE